jgi:hypothetical protein
MKVNWNELPVDRDPATVEYDDWYQATEIQV